MNLLTKKDIEKYFMEINKRLSFLGKHGEIIMTGGAALTVVFNARNSTYDIDAIFEPKEDLNKIIKDMSAEYDIHKDWLNDAVKGFLSDKMTYTIFKEFSNLKISSIDADCLLALKLTSARAFSKDMEDSITLMNLLKIENEGQLFNIIEQYIPKDRQTAQAYFFTQEAYRKYSERIQEKIINKKRKKKKSELER